jgi:Zn-dependent protease with chaperone function
MISRRIFTAGLGSALVGGLAGCVTKHDTGPATGIADLPPGHRPDMNSDEAGIWLQSDKAEAALRNSASRIRDEAITRLVADMTCRIAGKHCPHLRTYVLRVAEANATASPNGTLQFWSGILLRMESESHLAAIIGHECAHYIRRHSLARMRNVRNQADLALFLGLGLNMLGAPNGADLANMIAMGNISSFSREHEYEADALGLQLMADAGYDPMAAPSVWNRFIKINKAGGEKERFDFFLSTHPPSSEREKELIRLAEQRQARPSAPDRLRAALAPIRPTLLADEVNLGTFKRSQKLFDMMQGGDPAPGDIMFYRGELHRRRGKDDDDMIALGFYHEACEAAGAPPEAFRMVALIRWRRGEKDKAREYFRRYLHVKPDAGDRDMIGKYLAGA